MANYNTLITAIQQVIKTNGNEEITGALLQQSLLSMISSLGAGYQFMGVAIPATNPGTPDQKVFYIATQGGVYSNFGGIVVANDSVVILKYDSQWASISTNIVNKYTAAIFENELGLLPINIDNVLNLGNTYYILYANNNIYSNAAFNTSVCFFPVVGGKSYKLNVPKTGNNAMAVVAYANATDQTTGLISLGYIGNNDPREIEFTADDYPYIAVCFTTANGLPVLQQSATPLKNRVTANENAISALSNSIDNIGLKLSNLDFSTVANLFDITNYGLYVSILKGKKYNITTGILQNNVSYDSTTLVQLDKENPIYPGYIGNNNSIYFFDKDKNFISQVTGKYLHAPITPEDYPENAYYVAFSYMPSTLNTSVFYTLKKYESQYGYMYPTIQKIKNTRPIVNIYTTDDEDTIFEKLVNALLTGDCDVYWETGEYSFKQVYDDMQNIYHFGKLSGSWQIELPLGGNCHYYLNNSIITGQLPTGMIDAKVFGTNRAAGRPFVLEGGTIICDGMVYCIHDEGQGSPGFYTHIYKNLKMICKNGGICCIGGGSGENGKVLIENCEFHNVAKNSDVAYHGITGGGAYNNATFHVIVSDSWFSRGVQVNTLNENQTGKLTYMGNSASAAPIVLNDWEFVEWNNIIRQ